MRRLMAALGLSGFGLAAIGLYANRWALIGRALGLRPAEYDVAVERDLPLLLPDGVTLYADRFYPQAEGAFPTILIRTPYGRPSELGLFGGLSGARLFAERGYNVVVQSVRGRFRSEGTFAPFVHEAADGRATLEWVAAQPWFEGNLGMWGVSYVGYTQWAIAADAPPYLKAIVPVITSSRFSRALYPDETFSYETLLRWVGMLSATNRPGGTLDLAAVQQLLSPRREATLRKALATSPFDKADQATTGAAVPYFQRWLAEPDPEGPYWRMVDHHHSLGHVHAAVHLVAGWYDLFLAEQLADYTDLLAASRSPCLTVLPRHHTQPGLMSDAVREGLWWFDAHLKGRHELLERRAVRLALMDSYEWHEMDFWPPPAKLTRYYLHAEGMLSTRAPVGTAPTLTEQTLNTGAAAGETEAGGVVVARLPAAAVQAHRRAVSTYRYDPRDPTPAAGGPVLSPQGGRRAQGRIEARADVLTFTTSPLPAAVDVIGYVRLELYARSSLDHTDFVGRLCTVAPDGRSFNVCEGIVRVTPGVGEPQPDGSLRLEVDMWATAQRFKAGHSIRLHICSAAHPRWSANSGDGRPLTAGAPDGTPARQTIFHDAEHPSALVLPIVSTETRRTMAGDD